MVEVQDVLPVRDVTSWLMQPHHPDVRRMPVPSPGRVLSDRTCAALVWNTSTAQLARQHNDANVVSIGARQHSDDEATALVLEFLTPPFSGDERHVRRIGLISASERDRHRPAGGLPTHAP